MSAFQVDNSWFSCIFLVVFVGFFGVFWMGKLPNEAWERFLCSWVGFCHEKHKNLPKSCELLPLLRVRIGQFLSRVGSSPQQKKGEREKQLKRNLKILFIFAFFWCGKCKIQITFKGWLSFPGSRGVFCSSGERERLEFGFLTWFFRKFFTLASLFLLLSAPSTETPKPPRADNSHHLKNQFFPLFLCLSEATFSQLNFPPKASKSQFFSLLNSRWGSENFKISSPSSSLVTFSLSFCTAKFKFFFWDRGRVKIFFWEGEKIQIFLYFFQAVPTLCSPFSGGSLWKFQSTEDFQLQ